MKSGLEIAQEAALRPIADVAAAAGIEPDELEQFGRFRAKIDLAILDRLADRPDGKLIITTAITPTKAGEGKTTTSVSLTQGLGKIGKDVMLCLHEEPSMGPVFGIKGGGNGGGYAQVRADGRDQPALQRRLPRRPGRSQPAGCRARRGRVSQQQSTSTRDDHVASHIDVNDRQLRYTVVGLGGKAHEIPHPRGNSFVIVAASEIMAVFALASDVADLRRRLGNIVVASTHEKPVTAEDLRVAGALTVIMKDALKPNLVQTLEGQPVMIHAGPFGNIAHANNSIIADRVALKLADYVVTEGGFASDLGFQKFC